MSATYDETLPTDKDRVRMRLGDTDEDNPLHSDEHIEAVLAIEGSLDGAIVALADELVARFGPEPVQARSSDGAMVDYRSRLGVWSGIAQDARADVPGGALSFVPATYGNESTADEYARPMRLWPCDRS